MTGAASGLAAAAAGPSPLWYATRATGVVALVLLTVVVALGVAGAARYASPRWPRMITSGLHRNVSLLVVAFLAIHILTAMLDTFAPIGWASALIPFASSYRPLWLGLGTLAFDLMLTLVITSLLRARIGRRGWRVVHWTAYAAWPIALWHGLGAGTDAKLPLMLGIDLACAAAVVAAVWWRLSLVQDAGRRAAGIAASLAAPLATAIFVLTGPLQPGWALRAGTPPELLGHAAAAGTAPSGGSSAGSSALVSGALSGNAAQSGDGQGQTTVTITADTNGASREHVLVVLRGSAAGGGGGIAMSSGKVRVSSGGAVYQGAVTALDGGTVSATLTSPQGSQVPVQITVSIQAGAVTGQLSVSGGGA